MTTYVSGPMTGLPDLNFAAFTKRAAELRAAGRAVINPCEFGEEGCTEWHHFLRKDIRALMDCTAIHMLPGWSKSRGARLEHHIAVELGMAVEGASE